MMTKILNGIRVVEQGTFITGPCTGMMLADLGADVIKVESPGEGDPYRNFQGNLYSAHFQAYNRNKRSIALDLKTADDRKVFHDLIASADVYIQNFRPGIATRLGADAAQLQAVNPRLVYCSISGFGSDGPYVGRPSYDSVTQALSGFLSVVTDEKHPRLLGPALADAITGIYGSIGTLAALLERATTGRGRVVEVSMLEAMMHFATEPFYGYFGLGEVPTSLDRPRLAQAFVVRCASGGLIALHLSSMTKFWAALLAVLDSPSLAADPRFAERQDRIANYEALQTELVDIFSTRSREEWLERLGQHDLPYAPINSISEAVDDPQVEHLDIVVPVTDRTEGAAEAIRPPFTFDRVRATDVRAAPLLDEHGAAIRRAIARAEEVWRQPRLDAAFSA